MTDTNPVSHALQAQQSLRSLSDMIQNPPDEASIHPLLGLIDEGAGSLHEVVTSLAIWVADNAAGAVCAVGGHRNGPDRARVAAAELHEAAGLIEEARTKIETAHVRYNSLNWQQGTETSRSRADRLPPESTYGRHTSPTGEPGISL